MPKRTGAKKGHKCGNGIDTYCLDCWATRLKAMGLSPDADARRDKVTYMPQRDLERWAWALGAGEQEGVYRGEGIYAPSRLTEPCGDDAGHDHETGEPDETDEHVENKTRLNAILSETLTEN